MTPSLPAGQSAAAEMKITALLPYFGGKRTLSPTIVEEFGSHRAYWETMCGSLAVLFSKEPSSMETVNDLSGDVTNLCRVVQCEDTAVQLFERLTRTMMHEDLHREAAERWKVRKYSAEYPEPDLDAAYDYFLCSWVGRNGVTGTKSYNQGFCVRYTKNGGHAATRFRSAIDSIPAWCHRLADVTILRRCGIDLCDKIEDAAGVVIYADPPYLVKGAKYIHDFDWLAHRRLAKALSRFKKTRVVVSYYDHPDLDAMYPGWTKRHTPTTKALLNQGKRDEKGGVTAPEILLINGDSYAKGDQ